MSELNTLFEKDPLKLTDQDLDTIVAALRQSRVDQIKEDAEAKSKGRKPKAKGTMKASAEDKAKAKTMSLDDLLGGI